VKVLIMACLLTGFIVFPASADIIYFKDGMKTICQERSWEENGEIKCEYAGWVISYQKADILRIVKTTRPKKTPLPKTSATTDMTEPDKKTTQVDKNRPVTQTTATGSVTKKIKTVLSMIPEDLTNTGPIKIQNISLTRKPFRHWQKSTNPRRSGFKPIWVIAMTLIRSTVIWQNHNPNRFRPKHNQWPAPPLN
jgi:hypothetical protein